MSGYRGQRPGASSRPGSIGSTGSSYDGFSRHRYSEQQHSSQQSSQQPGGSSSGSTYKPYWQSRSSSSYGSFRGDNRDYRERDRDRDSRERDVRDRDVRDREVRDRERVPSQSERYGAPRRGGYYSSIAYSGRNRDPYFSRSQPPRRGYNTYNNYSERNGGNPNYRDRRQRESYGSRYGTSRHSSLSGPGLREDVDNSWKTGHDQHHESEYDRTSSGSDYQRAPRPSLIPKDFKDDVDDDEEEDLILGKASRNSLSTENTETVTKRETSVHSDSAHEASDNAHEESHQETVSADEEVEENTKSITEGSKKLQEEPKNVEEKPKDAVQGKLETAADNTTEKRTGETTDTKTFENSDKQIPEKSSILEAVSNEPETLQQVKSLDDEIEADHVRTEEERNGDTSMREESEDESDYDPEADHEKIEKELHIKNEPIEESSESSVMVIEKEETKSNIDVEPSDMDVDCKNLALSKPLDSTSIHPLKQEESFCFPLRRTEQRVWELKNHSRDERVKRLPYLLKTPIKSLKEFSFYERTLLVHKQGILPKLRQKLSILKGSTFVHKISLLNEYAHRVDDHSHRLEEMDRQLKSFYPNEAQEEEEKSRINESPSEPRRRSRHADVVRSEAEFLEILESLEKEKEQDPLYRAEQVAARIPDMILDPIEKGLRFVNTNNKVVDKEAWAMRIKTDPVDNFTRAEHEAFCEAFLSFPKRFGRISNSMGGLRSAEECVLHYYKTKKSVTDYKQLLSAKKKRGKRGAKSRRGKAKSASNTPVVSTPNESADEKELHLEKFVPKDVSDELFTDTGRPRRAAAPVFDSEKKTTPDAPTIDAAESKRPLQSEEPSVETEDKRKKKQRVSKPKSRVVFVGESTKEVNAKGKNSISSYWSVRDIALFTKLLPELGTNWSEIASRLGTKSATMVRNFYARNADSHETSERTPTHEPQVSTPEPVAIPTSTTAQHRNPPLGFFTASANVPSNVNFTAQPIQPKPEPETSQLPVGNSFERSVLPTVSTFSTLSNQYQQPTPQVQQSQQVSNSQAPPHLPPLMPMSSSNFAPVEKQEVARSNPFSITSLLNPTEVRQLAPSLPVTGTFSPVQQKKAFFSSFDATSNANGDGLPPHQQIPEQSSFNPLDALVAAAEKKTFDEIPHRGRYYDPTAVSSPPKPKLPAFKSSFSSNIHNMLNDDNGQ